MRTYVMSDIHGMYNKFMLMLEKLQFSSADRLYVLGDLVQRGPDSVNVVREIMHRENVEAIMGNHDRMALDFRDPEIFADREVVEYLRKLPLYKEIEIAGQKYILVHAGLGAFSKEKKLESYSEGELTWTRTDYTKPYFEDIIVITGHTPTQKIPHNPYPGKIVRMNNHIAIDCGAPFKHGCLAALCLETGEEFYV